MTWSVRGIDDEARETALAAARRSGKPVGEWLNEIIRDRAQNAASAPAPEVGQLERELETLAQRLARLSGRAPEPAAAAPPPAPESDPLAPERVDERLRSMLGALDSLDQRLNRMAEAPPPPPPPRPSAIVRDDRPTRPGWPAAPAEARVSGVDDLALAMEEIGRRQRVLDPDLPPGPQIRPAQRPVLASDIDRQFEALNSRLEQLRPPAPVEPAAEIRAEAEADLRQTVADSMSSGLAPLAGTVDDLRDGLKRIEDMLSRRAGPDAALAPVMEELTRLRQEVSGRNLDAPLGALERGFGQIVAHLEGLRQASPVNELAARLEADLARLRAELAASPAQGDLAMLAQSLADLGRRIDLVAERQQAAAPSLDALTAAVTSRAPVPALERLDGRLDAIDARLQAMRTVEDRIADLCGRIETFEARVESAVIASDHAAHHRDLVSRLDGLGNHLTLISDPALAGTGGGADRIERLVSGQTEAAETRSAKLIAAIDDRFQRIAQHLDQTDSRLGSLGSIEDSLVELRGIIDRTAARPEAGHEAVREAVAEFVRLTRETGPDRAIAALVTELRELKDQTRGLEARTGDSLKAVQEALSSVAGLLQLRAGRASDPAAMPPVARETAPPPRAAEFTSDLVRTGAMPEAEAATPSRRTDFIAAARRAAQAAQAARLTEPAAPPAPAVAPDQEPDLGPEALSRGGALARIGAALRGRGKMVTAIAAALVLTGLATELTLSALESLGRRNGPVSARHDDPRGEQVQTGSIAAPKPAQVAEPAAARRPEAPLAQAPDAMPSWPVPTKAPSEAMASRPVPAPPASPPDPVVTGALPPAEAPRAAPLPPALNPPAAPPQAAVSFPAPADRFGPPALQQAVAKGDVRAAFEVALRYGEGQGIAADPKKAAEWYRRAAEAGFAPAQYRLASALEKGVGVTKDIAEAKKWYQTAADHGNVRAMHNLGVLHANDRDMAAALPWFQKAADFGLKDSQFNLGIIHALGSGVKQDLAQASLWFGLAARSGDTEAARKRDDLQAYLDEAAKTSIQQIVANWRAQPSDKAANDEVTPWNEAAVGLAKPAAPAVDDRVQRVQAALKAQGLFAGQANGKVTPEVTAAVKAFQRKAGLKATGEIDDALVNALKPKTI